MDIVKALQNRRLAALVDFDGNLAEVVSSVTSFPVDEATRRQVDALWSEGRVRVTTMRNPDGYLVLASN